MANETQNSETLESIRKIEEEKKSNISTWNQRRLISCCPSPNFPLYFFSLHKLQHITTTTTTTPSSIVASKTPITIPTTKTSATRTQSIRRKKKSHTKRKNALEN